MQMPEAQELWESTKKKSQRTVMRGLLSPTYALPAEQTGEAMCACCFSSGPAINGD